MTKRFYVAVLISCFCALACSGQDDKKSEPAGPSEYATLLARVQGGDLSIDFQRLRFSYMESPERHQAKDTSDQEKQMWKALNTDDYKEAIKGADAVLAGKFVDMNAHFVESHAYTGLHDTNKAEYHRAVFKGLLDSILHSGDGKSTKTAYVVIAVDEEYVVLNVLGLRPGSQALLGDGGHHYDRLDATNPKTNETVLLYFNVDIPIKHELN
jgi:uncharacterized protein DUF4919